MFVPLNTLKLLIVDDQSLVRTAMRHMLTALGAKHLTDASSGEEAIELLLKQEFDLVISDIDMSPINGLELLKHIRHGDYGLKRDTLLVMLTGVSTKEFVIACVNLDVNAFLTKPPKKELLMSRIQYALTTPFNLKEAKAYKLIVIPEINAPAAPAARANIAAVEMRKLREEEQESNAMAQVPGMHYIVWSDKFQFGLPSLDEILQTGARLLNRAYVDKGKSLQMEELDQFVSACFQFASERLREIEQSAGQSDEELQKRFVEVRLGLAANLARIRLIMQVSPDIVMYECFNVMKTWWHKTLDLMTEYRNRTTAGK